jgi:hypothetical protein
VPPKAEDFNAKTPSKAEGAKPLRLPFFLCSAISQRRHTLWSCFTTDQHGEEEKPSTDFTDYTDWRNHSADDSALMVLSSSSVCSVCSVVACPEDLHRRQRSERSRPLLWAGFSTPRTQTEKEQRSREDGKPALFPRLGKLNAVFSGPWKNPLAKFQGLEKGAQKTTQRTEQKRKPRITRRRGKASTDFTDYTDWRNHSAYDSALMVLSSSSWNAGG